MHDAHLARIVATEDFDTNFAAVDIFINAVGATVAREAAVAWSESEAPLDRAAGLDVLGVLALLGDDTAFDALVAAASTVPATHPTEDLRWSAAHALSANPRPPSLPVLLRFLDDPDGDIRWQVAYGLSELAVGFQDDDPAVRALRKVAQDLDADVRAAAERGLRQAYLKAKAEGTESSI